MQTLVEYSRRRRPVIREPEQSGGERPYYLQERAEIMDSKRIAAIAGKIDLHHRRTSNLFLIVSIETQELHVIRNSETQR